MTGLRCATLLVLLALSGCSSIAEPPAPAGLGPSQSVAPTPSTVDVAPTETSRTAQAPRFSASRAFATIEAIASFGPRESVGKTYRRAARYVARRLSAYGYEIERQRFTLPAGENDRIEVAGGPTYNVVARPPDLRSTDEQVVVGAHLDTTPDSPGANDNASGVAVMIELARLAMIDPPAVPVVFVAFAGEERVRQTETESVYAEGSREFVRRLSGREAKAIEGMLNIDMVGTGSLRVMGRDNAMTRLALRVARAIGVEARRDQSFFYSDHHSFDSAGVPATWLWTGDHPSFHSPADEPSVVEKSSLRATGRVAWALLRRLGP